MKTQLIQLTMMTLTALVCFDATAADRIGKADKLAPIAVGDRMYSTRNEQGQDIGAMTVTGISGNGIISVRTDNFGNRKFDTLVIKDFERAVDCGYKTDQFHYSTETYEVTDASGERGPKAVGIVAFTDTFGSCSAAGRVLIEAADAAAPKQVMFGSMLPEVKCDFTKKRVRSDALDLSRPGRPVAFGDGQVIKVYGSCTSGFAQFQPDRTAADGKLVTIPVSSFVKQEGGRRDTDNVAGRRVGR